PRYPRAWRRSRARFRGTWKTRAHAIVVAEMEHATILAESAAPQLDSDGDIVSFNREAIGSGGHVRPRPQRGPDPAETERPGPLLTRAAPAPPRYGFKTLTQGLGPRSFLQLPRAAAARARGEPPSVRRPARTGSRAEATRAKVRRGQGFGPNV